MNDIIQLQISQLVAAYLFVIIVMIMARYKKIDRQKLMVVASIRMTLQLILAGYLLIYLFEVQSIFYTLLFFMVMETFAIFTIIKNAPQKLSTSFKRTIAIAMFVSTSLCLSYFMLVVIQIEPWYDAQYLIPIGGMLIGNSMTGITLATSHLLNGFSTEKDTIETALMLGASPNMASQSIRRRAFDNAIMPTLNSMLGTGIVFLPGMMTGQILSGVSPLVAIKYQIAIMLGIFGCVALTSLILIEFGYLSFFTKDAQIKTDNTVH